MGKQGYPGNAGLYATVMDLYRTTRALSSEEYALRGPRERAAATASQAIARVTGDLAKGFTQFRQDWLFHPDTTYLKVSLNGRGYGSPGYDRYLTLSRIGFVVRDGRPSRSIRTPVKSSASPASTASPAGATSPGGSIRGRIQSTGRPGSTSSCAPPAEDRARS